MSRRVETKLQTWSMVSVFDRCHCFVAEIAGDLVSVGVCACVRLTLYFLLWIMIKEYGLNYFYF